MSSAERHVVMLQDWLFAWEIIASFSSPRTVCDLETLSRDVHKVIRDSSTGTRLMQRYWNVQYHRLVWGDEDLDIGKRTLHFSLPRASGRKNWKKLYREEYPLWLARTFQGMGSRNNDINEAKVRFQVEPANELLSGEAMESLELTQEETVARRVAKGFVRVEEGSGSGPNSVDRRGRRKSGGSQNRKEKLVAKDPAEGLQREDYKNDRHLQKHRTKHNKGKRGTWDGYADGEFD